MGSIRLSPAICRDRLMNADQAVLSPLELAKAMFGHIRLLTSRYYEKTGQRVVAVLSYLVSTVRYRA